MYTFSRIIEIRKRGQKKGSEKGSHKKGVKSRKEASTKKESGQV
jgi:hypothetical protein